MMYKLLSIILVGLLVLGCVSSPQEPSAPSENSPPIAQENQNTQSNESPVESSESTEDKPMVGNDRDEHGCIGSAGYVWCESKRKCIRLFEESCESLEMPSEPQEPPEMPPEPGIAEDLIEPPPMGEELINEPPEEPIINESIDIIEP